MYEIHVGGLPCGEHGTLSKLVRTRSRPKGWQTGYVWELTAVGELEVLEIFQDACQHLFLGSE